MNSTLFGYIANAILANEKYTTRCLYRRLNYD